jgi:5-methylcytosine-specific restriction protein A
MKITKEAVHRIYTLCLAVCDSTYKAKKAIEFIKAESIMSEGSARIYFNIFKSLMNVVGHTRAMNEYSTIYFLESIYIDYGRNKLLDALKATAAHVTYYNSLGKGNRQSISNVINQFNDKYNQ